MQPIPTRSFLVCVVAVLGVAACGGGGGTSPSPENQSINIPVEQDALVTASFILTSEDLGLPLISISVGDDGGNNGYKGLMRFPLASVPSGANVVGAWLHLEIVDRRGSPGDLLSGETGGLGDIEFHRTAGTALSIADYNAPVLAHDSDSNLTVDPPVGAKTVGCLALVQSALANSDSHLKVRVQYQDETDDDEVLDQLRLGTLREDKGAILEVVIEL